LGATKYLRNCALYLFGVGCLSYVDSPQGGAIQIEHKSRHTHTHTVCARARKLIDLPMVCQVPWYCETAVTHAVSCWPLILEGPGLISGWSMWDMWWAKGIGWVSLSMLVFSC
jgi:hypothetical protein